MAGSLPVYDWFGKTRLSLGGVGSIRLPVNLGDDDRYACLSAVSAKSWNVDLGIPIVVSKQVYREFVRARHTANSTVEADLRGRVVLGEMPGFFRETPSALDQETISEGFQRLLRTPLGIPMAYVHVVSPIDCDFRTNDTHPKCNAWTLFRCSNSKESIKSASPDAKRMLSGLGAFGITFCAFQPDNSKDTKKAITFLQDSPRWLRLTRDQSWNNWVKWGDTPSDKAFRKLAKAWSKLDVRLITDFDGLVPRLTNSVFNLATRPTTQGSFAPFINDFDQLVKEFDAGTARKKRGRSD